MDRLVVDQSEVDLLVEDRLVVDQSEVDQLVVDRSVVDRSVVLACWYRVAGLSSQLGVALQWLVAD